MKKLRETSAGVAEYSVGIAEPPLRMSYEEFLDWADEDTLAEWVNGEVIMTSPASVKHQEIKSFIAEVLKKYAKLKDLGKVLDAPFQMKLTESGREPDVIFIAKANLGKLQSTFYDGGADIAVEVVSPESVNRDKTDKYKEYEAGGVREYWLIDAVEDKATFYRLENGKYKQVKLQDGKFYSDVMPGFWLQIAWLWQNPLLEVEDVMLEIAKEAFTNDILEKLRKKGIIP
jgi:Uma2 family endonuclease